MKKARFIIFTLVLSLFVIIPFRVNAALLSNLEVEGIGSLSTSRKNYTLGYQTPFNYVNITATGIDESVKVEGAGKVSINEGANKIVITATNGTETDTYTINLNVTKKAASGSGSKNTTSDTDVKNPETGYFISLIGLGIALVGAITALIIANKNKKIHNV